MKTGIALFVYNRPEHTKKVLEGLKKNNIDKLYIFADGPKKEEHIPNVTEVKNLIKSVDWCRTDIIISDKNKGLANSIIDGVNYVLNHNERVIVLEDDCVPAADFIGFMNKCFDKYEDEEKVMNITGYSLPIKFPQDYIYDIYFSYRSCSWGWGTWKRAWNFFRRDRKVLDEINNSSLLRKQVNDVGQDLIPTLEKYFNNQLDIWAAFWAVNIIKNNGICINPIISLIQNIGFDGTGVHCTNHYKFDVDLVKMTDMNLKFPLEIRVDERINNEIRDFFGEVININSEFINYIQTQGFEKVLIFGTGNAGKIAYKYLQNFKIDIIGFLDNNPDKWNDYYLTKKIYQPTINNINEADRIIIASSWKKEIITKLMAMGLKQEKIISLL